MGADCGQEIAGPEAAGAEDEAEDQGAEHAAAALVGVGDAEEDGGEDEGDGRAEVAKNFGVEKTAIDEFFAEAGGDGEGDENERIEELFGHEPDGDGGEAMRADAGEGGGASRADVLKRCEKERERDGEDDGECAIGDDDAELGRGNVARGGSPGYECGEEPLERDGGGVGEEAFGEGEFGAREEFADADGSAPGDDESEDE